MKQEHKQQPASVYDTSDENPAKEDRNETVCDGLLPSVAALFVGLSDSNRRAITELILPIDPFVIIDIEYFYQMLFIIYIVTDSKRTVKLRHKTIHFSAFLKLAYLSGIVRRFKIS